MMRFAAAGIAAQLGIALDLCRLQQLDSRQMVPEMRSAEPGLRVADCRRRPPDCRRRRRVSGEQRVQRLLFSEQPLANRDRLGLHRLEQTLDALLLVIAESKLA